MTPKQRKVMLFIQDHVDKTGLFPRLKVICKELGYSSKTQVHEPIERLIEQGFLARTNGLRRRQSCIEIVRRIEPIVEIMVFDDLTGRFVPYRPSAKASA